jgi:putative tricarboxylic transport membrane protein
VTPIAVLASEYVIFAVNSNSTIKSGRELISTLQSDPGKFNIGIATALGGASHIAVAQAMKAAGVNIHKLNFIVYPSSAEAVTALLGAHIDMVAASVGNFLPALQTNRLRPLAITSPQRLGGVLRDIPTWKEQGINMTFASWRGMAGPKDMSRDQIAYWNDVFKRLVTIDEWKRSLESEFAQSTYMNSEESKGFLEDQFKTLKAVLGDLQVAK